LTSGRRVFQQHTERTEGSDTTPASHTRKGPVCAERRSRNFGRSKKRSRSPAGPRRLGTATRMSASLFRGSLRSSGAHPTKTQKGQSMPFYPLATQGFRTAQNGQRVEIAPPSKAPLFRPVSRCVRFFSESRGVYPLSLAKANVGQLCRRC